MSTAADWGSVSRTALGVARVRARESQRPDRLFDDPHAAAFELALPTATAREQQRPAEAGSLRAAVAVQIIIRTRFFDDYLLAACHAGCRQVVLVAAGLDTRAFRLPWPPEVRLFELDLAPVLRFKDRVLSEQEARPRCRRLPLAVDLRQDWQARLLEAGFLPGEATAWLVEGLLVYLTAEEAGRVLASIGELSAPGSQLSCERGREPGARPEPASEADAALLSLWKGGLGMETAGWLRSQGWQVQSHDLAAVAASHGRRVPAGASSGFLTAYRDSS